MSPSWFDRKKQEAGEWAGFLEKGVRLDGRLECPGTFRIDSSVKGILVSEEVLILGENARVEGEIHGVSVLIAGRFVGTIEAKGKVEIQPKAIVSGEIHTPCLIIEPGAVFDGQCHMLSHSQNAKPITIPIRSAVAQA